MTNYVKVQGKAATTVLLMLKMVGAPKQCVFLIRGKLESPIYIINMGTETPPKNRGGGGRRRGKKSTFFAAELFLGNTAAAFIT